MSLNNFEGRFTAMTPAERRTRSRQSVLLTRALNAPDGLTPYAFTKGMLKEDALMFWADARALGLHVLGKAPSGAKMLGLTSTVEPLLPGEVPE